MVNVQSKSESAVTAHLVRTRLDQQVATGHGVATHADIKSGDSVVTRTMGSSAFMNVVASKEVREALRCIDLKMKEFTGNIFSKSKDWEKIQPRFFISSAAGTGFPMAVEGYGAYSITYLHAGAPKIWYIIKPDNFRHVEEFVFVHRQNKADIIPPCGQFVRHESFYMDEKTLAAGVDFTRVTQNPGEIIVTFPFAYHQGYDAGPNIAETMVYGSDRWANIFTQNPEWYKECTDGCVGKGLWKPEAVDMKFIKAVKEIQEGPVPDLDDLIRPMTYTPGKYTRYGTLRRRPAELDAAAALMSISRVEGSGQQDDPDSPGLFVN